jgi:glycosyltransferase involved in cell wall biosynthesis
MNAISGPMRIAFFTETFLPKTDGIVNVLCHHFDGLAEAGHESLLFAPVIGRKEQNSDRYANTRIVRYAGHPFPWYPDLHFAFPDRTLPHHLDRFQPDLIHVVNPVTLGRAGIRQARRRKLPLVASFHTDIVGFARAWGMGIAARPLWSMVRALHNRADLNLVPSEVTRRQVMQHGVRRVEVWPHGVDSERFDPAKRSAAWRERLTEGEVEKPLLIFVSRVSAEKGVEWLPDLLDALPGTRLAVVGDGPARPALAQRLAGKPAVLTGWLHGEELAAAWASGDIFVFPSPHETFGNVVLEAMACGLPVVAPRSGGLLDFMHHREHGLLFVPDSRDEFIETTRRLVNDLPLAARLGRNGRRAALEMSWARVSADVVARYQTLIHRHQGAPELAVPQPEYIL